MRDLDMPLMRVLATMESDGMALDLGVLHKQLVPLLLQMKRLEVGDR